MTIAIEYTVTGASNYWKIGKMTTKFRIFNRRYEIHREAFPTRKSEQFFCLLSFPLPPHILFRRDSCDFGLGWK